MPLIKKSVSIPTTYQITGLCLTSASSGKSFVIQLNQRSAAEIRVASSPTDRNDYACLRSEELFFNTILADAFAPAARSVFDNVHCHRGFTIRREYWSVTAADDDRRKIVLYDVQPVVASLLVWLKRHHAAKTHLTHKGIIRLQR